MSILDELKKQAREKTEQDQNLEIPESAGEDTAIRIERNWKQLSPKMHLIYNFLKEVTESLNIVRPDNRVDFHITKSIVIKDMRQEDFELVKPGGSMKEFVFRYKLLLNHKIKITINSETGSEKFRELLTRRQIHFTNEVLSPAKMLFVLEPKFTTKFTFTADLENCRIILRIENFDGAWATTIRYPVNRVTRELMEEMARYILLKENNFMVLSGNTVSEDVREELRKKLMEDGKIPKDEDYSSESLMERTATRLKSLFGR